MEEGGSSHRKGGGQEGGAGSKRKLITSGELYAKYENKSEVGVPSSKLKRSKAESWAKKIGHSVQGGTQATLSFSKPKEPQLQATFEERPKLKIPSVDSVRSKSPLLPLVQLHAPYPRVHAMSRVSLTIHAFARRRSLMSTPLRSWNSLPEIRPQLLFWTTPLLFLQLRRRTSNSVLHLSTRRRTTIVHNSCHLVSSLLLPAPH
jgi:hypothetical protein